MVNFDRRVILPDGVLMRPVGDEAVLLNLDTNTYFALNPVGADMLIVLTQSSSIEQAFTRLLDMYDIAPDVMRADLQELIEDLAQQGLVLIA
ncbi:MAG TPA: PqqD family protein [Anaerolineales bacterium]